METMAASASNWTVGSMEIPVVPTLSSWPSPPSPPAATADSAWMVDISAAFLVAGFVHGAVGFGAGMTAMAIAPIGVPLMDAVAIVAVYVLFVCLVLAVQLRHSLANPQVRRALPALCLGSVAGVPVGVKLLTAVDPLYLKIGCSARACSRSYSSASSTSSTLQSNTREQ